MTSFSSLCRKEEPFRPSFRTAIDDAPEPGLGHFPHAGFWTASEALKAQLAIIHLPRKLASAVTSVLLSSEVKRQPLLLLLVGKFQVESLVIRNCATASRLGRRRYESREREPRVPQTGPLIRFASLHLQADRTLARVGRVEPQGLPGFAGRAIGDGANGEVWRLKFGECQGDGGVGFILRRMAGRDVERERQRVVSHARRVMTSSTRSVDFLGIAKGGVVVQPPERCDF